MSVFNIFLEDLALGQEGVYFLTHPKSIKMHINIRIKNFLNL